MYIVQQHITLECTDDIYSNTVYNGINSVDSHGIYNKRLKCLRQQFLRQNVHKILPPPLKIFIKFSGGIRSSMKIIHFNKKHNLKL